MLEPRCIVCGTHEGIDGHHIFPVGYGNSKDGPQVNLCAICHRNIHTAAGRVYSGKSNFLELFTAQEFINAKVLIQAIVNSKIKMETSGRGPNTIRRLMLEIPSSLYLSLTQAKVDANYPSMEKFLIAVLEQAVK